MGPSSSKDEAHFLEATYFDELAEDGEVVLLSCGEHLC